MGQAELSTGVVNAEEISARCCPGCEHHCIPEVPGWLLGTQALAAWGQPSELGTAMSEDIAAITPQPSLG